jgi:hypothetical protein
MSNNSKESREMLRMFLCKMGDFGLNKDFFDKKECFFVKIALFCLNL